MEGLAHWPFYAIAILSAVVAGFSALPYGWAHVTALALSAALSAFMAATGVAAQKGKLCPKTRLNSSPEPASGKTSRSGRK